MLNSNLIQFERAPTGLGGLFYGVYPALVTDLKDPDKQGRVEVKLPWAIDPDGGVFKTWARLATLMAGKNRGTWFVPDPGDEVLVAFEGGSPMRPYVIGALWNGKDTPADSMDGAGQNNHKMIRTRTGIKITLDETPAQVKITLETPGGQKIILKDDPGANGIDIMDATGNSIKLALQGITVNAAIAVKVQATEVEIQAPMVKVNAAMTQFSGVVQCSSIIAPNVIGSTYTPGGGNIL